MTLYDKSVLIVAKGPFAMLSCLSPNECFLRLLTFAWPCSHLLLLRTLRINHINQLGFFSFWTSARCARCFLSHRQKAYLL